MLAIFDKEMPDSLEVQQMRETLPRMWPDLSKQDQNNLYRNAQAVLKRITVSQWQGSVLSKANIGEISSELLALQHEIILMWEDSQLEFQQHFRTVMQQVSLERDKGIEVRSPEDLQSALDRLF